MTMFGRAAPAGRGKVWATWILVGLAAGPFLLAWAVPGVAQFTLEYLGLNAKNVLVHPWTVFTYPLADTGNGGGAIWTVFLCFWIYGIATALERDLGGSWLLGVFGIATLLHGLMAVVAGMFNPLPAYLMGVDMPVTFVSILWCGRNQSVVIRLFGLIPVTGRVLAIILAVVSVLAYGSGARVSNSVMPPLYGIAVCLPLALAWFYGADKLPMRYGRPRRLKTTSKPKEKEFDKFITDVRSREKEREERERLRKLFEDSMDDK